MFFPSIHPSCLRRSFIAAKRVDEVKSLSGKLVSMPTRFNGPLLCAGAPRDAVSIAAADSISKRRRFKRVSGGRNGSQVLSPQFTP